MTSIPPVVHLVAWAALATGLGVALVQQHDLARRLDADAPRREEAPAAPGAADLAGGKEALGLKTRVDEVAAKLGAALTENAKLRADHDRLVAAVMAMPDGQAAVETSGKFVERPGFEDAVRGVMDRYATERKFREALKKATGPLVPKKPKFAELARALELRPEQASRFEQDVREIQTELFQILQLPRSDGISPLEEIQQAEQYPEGNPKRGEAFLRLVKLTIPDTQETYFERAVALASRVKEGTKAYFDDSQRAVLDTLDLDWFGIQMPQ